MSDVYWDECKSTRGIRRQDDDYWIIIKHKYIDEIEVWAMNNQLLTFWTILDGVVQSEDEWTREIREAYCV